MLVNRSWELHSNVQWSSVDCVHERDISMDYERFGKLKKISMREAALSGIIFHPFVGKIESNEKSFDVCEITFNYF